MFPKPNSLEILPRWYVSFQTWHACRESTGTDGPSLGPLSLTDPKSTIANHQHSGYKNNGLWEGGPKNHDMFCISWDTGLGAPGHMFSSTLFPQAVLEIHCILNENWGCPSCFPYKGLGREVSPAEVHSLQQNLGGFFLSSERHIEHQGNNKNWAEELGQNTEHRYRQRYWIYLRGTKYIQFVPHPRAQGPLISLAMLFLLSSDKVLLA